MKNHRRRRQWGELRHRHNPIEDQYQLQWSGMLCTAWEHPATALYTFLGGRNDLVWRQPQDASPEQGIRHCLRRVQA